MFCLRENIIFCCFRSRLLDRIGKLNDLSEWQTLMVKEMDAMTNFSVRNEKKKGEMMNE